MIFLFVTLLFCSCSKNTESGFNETENLLSSSQTIKLPADFTIDKIKSALLEYINYRLWLYPAKIKDNISDKSFDDYINKTIFVEIRAYENLERSVYCHTSIGNWLLVFNSKSDFVYCEGQVAEGETYWPNNNTYEIIEKYSVLIPNPHKPNYGSSSYKNKVIAAVEAKVRSACESFYKDSSTENSHNAWINVNAYIADFYEYEEGTQVWLYKSDGSILCYSVAFLTEKNDIKVQSLKPDEYKNKDAFNEFGRNLFDKNINDAVSHFKCNIE